MNIVIGLIGQKLTGKDTVGEYLVQQHGAVSLVMSHVLDDILDILGLEMSRANEMQLAVALRAAFEEAVLNNAILKRLQKHPSGIRLINGIRRPDEAKQAKAAGVRLVYICTSPEERYRRYQQRQEKKDDGVLSFEAFLEQDLSSPTEKDIPALQSMCEYTIQNDADVAGLHAQIDACLEQLSNS